MNINNQDEVELNILRYSPSLRRIIVLQSYKYIGDYLEKVLKKTQKVEKKIIFVFLFWHCIANTVNCTSVSQSGSRIFFMCILLLEK